MAVQEQHDLADHLLFGPAAADPLRPLGPDAGDLLEPFGRLLDHVEHRLAEGSDQLAGVDQLWSMLVYGSGGSLLLGSLNGFAVAEAHAIDHLSEALRAVQPTPVPLGRLGKHEDHCKGGLA
jgi:hypothetical protein